MKHFTLLLFLSFALFSRDINAQCSNPAALETSFGTSGSLISYSDKYSDHIATARTPDGDIVSVGLVDDGTQTSVFVSKIHADGTYSTAFGSGIGIVEIAPFVSATKTYSPVATDVVVLPNGNIAITGYSIEHTTLDRQVMLILLNPNGSRTSMPTNISVAGISFYKRVGSNLQYGKAIDVDAAGNLYIAADYEVGGIAQPSIWKIDPATASTIGSFTGLLPYPTTNTISVQDIEIDSYGFINIAASATYPSSVLRGLIIVLSPTNGNLSSYFNINAHTGSTVFTNLRKIKVLNDGTILATGSASNNGNTEAFIAKYYQNGSPVNSFGTSGLRYVYGSTNTDIGLYIGTFNNESVIVVSGSTGNTATTSGAFVTKLSSAGTLDLTYNSGSATFTVSTTILNGYQAAPILSDDGHLIIAASLGTLTNERAKHIRIALKCTPVITFANATQTTIYGANFTNTATSTSSAAITYSVSSGATNLFVNSSTASAIPLHAGSATLQASQPASDDFYAGSATCPVTINKASLTVTANAANRTYGAANPVFTVAYSGFVNSDGVAMIDVPPVVGSPAIATTPVGFYTLTPSGGSDNDYNFTAYTNGQFSIIKAPLTVVADNKTKIQGVANPAFTYTISGFVNGENASVVTGAPTLQCSAVTASPVGTYPITLLLNTLSAANYNFPNLIAGQLTIGAADDPGLVLANVVKTYGDANFTLSATSNSPGAITYLLLAGSGGTVSSSGAVTIVSGGTLTVRVSQAASAPYGATMVTSSITIHKKPLLAVVNNVFRYEGVANPPLTLTYTGFVNGNTAASLDAEPHLFTIANAASAPGVYAITNSGGSDDAYEYIYQDGTITVEALLAPTINTADVAKVYGDDPFYVSATSNSPGAITYSLVSGSTGTSIATDGLLTINNVGSGTVLISQAASGPYAASTAYAYYYIDKKALAVSADNYSRIPGVSNPTFTYTITGFVYGENESVISGEPELNSDAVSGSPEGSYDIRVMMNTLSASNYQFTIFRYGTLLVSSATGVVPYLHGPEITVYPVPSSDGSFTISGQDNISEVILVSANGQTEKYTGATYITTGMKGMIKVLIVTEKGVYVKGMVMK